MTTFVQLIEVAAAESTRWNRTKIARSTATPGRRVVASAVSFFRGRKRWPMTEPKVSERMLKLVREATQAASAFALDPCGPRRLLETTESRNTLLSAIAEIEQRAEKWKEVALAIREGALCARGFMLTKRVEAAFEALGDEWDEAVKGEG